MIFYIFHKNCSKNTNPLTITITITIIIIIIIIIIRENQTEKYSHWPLDILFEIWGVIYSLRASILHVFRWCL